MLFLVDNEELNVHEILTVVFNEIHKRVDSS
jgi:hypothetical protein